MGLPKKKSENFKCNNCKKVFESKILLNHHTSMHHNFKCSNCNKVFTSKLILEVHLKENYYFKCDRCQFISINKEGLMKHNNMNHKSCTECEDEFSWPESGHSCYYTVNNIRPQNS